MGKPSHCYRRQRWQYALPHPKDEVNSKAPYPHLLKRSWLGAPFQQVWIRLFLKSKLKIKSDLYHLIIDKVLTDLWVG